MVARVELIGREPMKRQSRSASKSKRVSLNLYAITEWSSASAILSEGAVLESKASPGCSRALDRNCEKRLNMVRAPQKRRSELSDGGSPGTRSAHVKVVRAQRTLTCQGGEA